MVNDLRVLRCAKCGNVYLDAELTVKDEFNGVRSVICVGCGTHLINVRDDCVHYLQGIYPTFCKSIVDHRPKYDNSFRK